MQDWSQENEMNPGILKRIKLKSVYGATRVLVDGEIVGQRPASDEAFTLGLQVLAQKLVYEQMVAQMVTAQMAAQVKAQTVAGWQ